MSGQDGRLDGLAGDRRLGGLAERFRPALSAAGTRLAAALLGTGCVIWADTGSAVTHKGWAGLALSLAIFGVAAGAIRLALAGVPVPEDTFLLPAPLHVWLWFLRTLRAGAVGGRRAAWPSCGWRCCTRPGRGTPRCWAPR